MSSSSSPSSDSHWIYDVFINFRGEDTRKNFVSHLHAALSNAGINTFLDLELHRGIEIEVELLRAITDSHIAIVVFSKNYTESSWCLNELVKIMECNRTQGQIVIPVFYDVDPSVVRHQKDEFGEKLEATAEQRFGEGEVMETVLSNWKTTITRAANFSGWDVSNFRSEGEVMRQIVKDVMTKLNGALLSITEFPVGLEARVQEVIQYIKKQSRNGNGCVVGIWGMGGSGKTTVAKAIYNKIHHKYVDRSFIGSIREVCEKDNRGYIHLQEQLIWDVLKTKEKVHNIAMGEIMIEKILKGKKALVILDDVTTFEQLKTLCGNRKWSGSGRVLVVTTRDVRLLNLLDANYVCQVKEMDVYESLELFSWHAFREGSPIHDFSDLSRNVVAYCGGLPLALEVLGSYLYKREKQEWRGVLSKLKMIPNDQVQEKLRISYDGLKDDLVKDIFLDICCFFIGKERGYVTQILNGCGLYADIGITVLIEQSLIKIENNKLGMHDLLRDMGREIVRESSLKELGKRSRLWYHEDVHDVLTNNIGTKDVEGLILKLQETGRVRFSTNAFKKMERLRLLQLDCVDLTGDYGYLSRQLRWVYWQGSTFKCVPDDFYLGNLVVLEIKYSSMKLVWRETKLLDKLKVLNLSHSNYLKSTPDFSKLPNLEKLIMKNCPCLSKIHQSIGDLKNLLLINLKDCTSLENLPKSIYQLKALKTLNLSGCSKIDKLEEDIVQMESLTTLIAKDTSIKEVPHSIVRSKSIGYISLCGLEGLSRDVFPSLIWSWMSPTTNCLPRMSPLGGMSEMSLVSLDVESNNNLGYLSPILSSLTKLRSVWVQCRSEIQLTNELKQNFADLYDVNFTEMETTSQTSDTSFRSLMIGMGNCHIFMDTLGKTISQGLTTNDDCSNFFLPGGNYPSWLAYTGEGPSVRFQVPEDVDGGMKGINLCVIYSSTSENLADECLSGVLIINYTKCTVQIYKRDTVMSFNDEDWEGVTSSLKPGDSVEISVAFSHALTVNEMAVYLIYGQLIGRISDRQPSSPEVNKTPSSPEVNKTPSPNVEMGLSPNMEGSPPGKSHNDIFTRFAKRMGHCLCLNRNTSFNYL